MAPATPRYPSRAAFALPYLVDVGSDFEEGPSPRATEHKTILETVRRPSPSLEDRQPSEKSVHIDGVDLAYLGHHAHDQEHELSAIEECANAQHEGIQRMPGSDQRHELATIAESPLAQDQRELKQPGRKWSLAAHSPAQFLQDASQSAQTVKYCEDLHAKSSKDGHHGFESPYLKGGLFSRTGSNSSVGSSRSQARVQNKVRGKLWQKSFRQATFRGVFSFRKQMATNYGFGAQTMQRITHFQLKASDVSVGEKIGEGCIGEVFVGELESAPEKAVAIKKLREGLGPDAEEVQGLAAELRVLSQSLKHPCIVEFVGLCMKESALLIVMELMEGGSLEDHFTRLRELDRDHPIRESLATALAWSSDLLEGLSYLHEKQPPLIHRDLKPGNLMLTGDRKRVKIADFGLAKSVEALQKAKRKQNKEGDDASEADTEEHRTPAEEEKKNLIVGTPRYIAPEIWIGGKGVATEKVDIYAASLVIWGIVEGNRPWGTLSGDVAATMAKTADRPPMNPKLFPEVLRRVLADGWAMEAAERPTAASMLSDLKPLKEKAEAAELQSGSFVTRCVPFRGCRF